MTFVATSLLRLDNRAVLSLFVAPDLRATADPAALPAEPRASGAASPGVDVATRVLSVGSLAPVSVHRYPLESPPGSDDRTGPAAAPVVEYDVQFDREPPALEAYLPAALAAARAAGARVAWFAFEGSFSYDHLLTADVASSVYAVADDEGTAIALSEDDLGSAAWRARISRARAVLLSLFDGMPPAERPAGL